jgi:acyl carrier protein
MISFQDELVRTALALYLDLRPTDIHPHARLNEDLGLEPLDLILVLFRLEEFTDVEFAAADLESVATVSDLERVVRESVRAARDADEPDGRDGDPSRSGVHAIGAGPTTRAAGTK